MERDYDVLVGVSVQRDKGFEFYDVYSGTPLGELLDNIGANGDERDSVYIADAWESGVTDEWHSVYSKDFDTYQLGGGERIKLDPTIVA